ncbi:hypothetical protein RLDS_03555 [Sphingobium lactosutens DS20]|uniref:Uncharacterized protein n=1 Tax=Sphingobium lactosutens DS20 TaxID=1331060 RepID=T0J7K2_9SPHN|nr:hypothetical protein RLDS_03555 [Sphingobium lactosutens DS20]
MKGSREAAGRGVETLMQDMDRCWLRRRPSQVRKPSRLRATLRIDVSFRHRAGPFRKVEWPDVCT